jgi:hypothetical protein
LLAADGYNRNEKADNERTRLLAYTMAKPYLKDQNMSPYEFWPLEGDPTPEEINEEQQERLEKEMKAAAEARERIIKKFKQRNGGL